MGIISESTWILIAGQVILALGMIIKALSDYNNRIQDRLDRESSARMTQKGLDETKAELKRDGDERAKSIIQKVQTVEKKADAAYNAGNGNQEKFAAVTSILEVHAKALSAPTQVEIVNDQNHPVPTVDTPKN